MQIGVRIEVDGVVGHCGRNLPWRDSQSPIGTADQIAELIEATINGLLGGLCRELEDESESE